MVLARVPVYDDEVGGTLRELLKNFFREKVRFVYPKNVLCFTDSTRFVISTSKRDFGSR